MAAEQFTPEELAELERRANELATEHEADAGLRAALHLFAESAGNLIPKLTSAEDLHEDPA